MAKALQNEERAHSGKYCYGKTPMQTFIDSVHLAKATHIDERLKKGANFNESEEAEAGSAAK